MSNELYRELKQYIHNELGITKDDIRNMVKECVAEEVKNVLQDTSNYNKFLGNQVNQYLAKNGSEFKQPFYTSFTPKCLDKVVYDTVVSELNKIIKKRVVLSSNEIGK